jgi:hypothetical protein
VDSILAFGTHKPQNLQVHCIAEDGYDYRYKRWMDNGVLSFIPPDGEFKLLDYQVAVPTGTLRPIDLPFNLKAKMSTEVGGGRYWLPLDRTARFKLKPWLRLARKIQLDAIVKYARSPAGKRRHKHSVGSRSDFGIRYGFGRHSRHPAWWREKPELPGRSVRWWKLGLRSKQRGAQVDDQRSHSQREGS